MNTTIRTGLKDIPLNDFALNLLSKSEWFHKEENYNATIKGFDQYHNDKDADYYTGEEYMREIMAKNQDHDGFPEVIVSHSFGKTNLKFQPNQAHRDLEVLEQIEKVNNTLQRNLCLKQNALFAVYPPGGYISWHNNANAPAYNLIFTYSETGDGWFQYYDMSKEKVITIQDKPGWQCKGGYFGAYAQPRRTWCYHAARNGHSGIRMTIAYTFDRHQMSMNIQDDVIEDISA